MIKYLIFGTNNPRSTPRRSTHPDGELRPQESIGHPSSKGGGRAPICGTFKLRLGVSTIMQRLIAGLLCALPLCVAIEAAALAEAPPELELISPSSTAVSPALR